MYRQPGADSHQNITDVLDEIILTLHGLADKVKTLEESIHIEDQN